IRCLDWDRDRFDIEFALKNGTTYNSFLIRGEKTALIDTTHRKFLTHYLGYITQQMKPSELDYLVVNHTEPDHSGLIKEILDWAPHITIVGSKVAIQFLENMLHQPFASKVVKSGQSLDLGRGHELSFVSAPNLHWPDTIFTYDTGTRVLYTCDVFGMHYCDDFLFDQAPHLLDADFKYYYDCLMGPNARAVLMALKRIQHFSVDTIATGHGPLLREHRADWMERYRVWSQNQAKAETFVAICYVEGYGYSDRIVQAIADGISKTGVAVEQVEMTASDPHEIRELVHCAAGLVVGMPPQASQPLSDQTARQLALSTLLAAAQGSQVIGLFEPGGGQDEPIYPLRNQFQEIGLKETFPPITIRSVPTKITDQQCYESGLNMGQALIQTKTARQRKQIAPSLSRALGRLSTGLYIVTAKKGEVVGAMLASWVIQASFEPLGVAIAVSKDRAMASLLQTELSRELGESDFPQEGLRQRFVLNVLEENNYQPLMKHFLKRFPPGADRFAGIETYAATNGSPVLAQALAYMECEVTSRLDCGDHWVIYSTVQAGRVAKREGVSAVHHRKASNHY
ncbi:MAG: diflavin flavoprotein, partial [Cyanobacteria bacterium J06649_4]